MTASPLVRPDAPSVSVLGAVTQPPAEPAPAPAHVVNLPNALTLGRLLVVPVFAVLLVTAGASAAALWAATALFVAACVTDVIDGRLARSRGQVTAFGVMADPIADKALVGTALVGLSLAGVLPWWATGLVLGREIGVTALRMGVRRHGLLPASRGGKLKCLTQNAAVTLYLVPVGGLLAVARLPVLLLAVVATIATGLDYALRGWRLRQDALAVR